MAITLAVAAACTSPLASSAAGPRRTHCVPSQKLLLSEGRATTASCGPARGASAGFSGANFGRIRCVRVSCASGGRLRQKRSCSNDSSSSDGHIYGDYDASKSESLASLFPLLSQVFLSRRLSLRRLRRKLLTVNELAKHKGRVGTYKREGNVNLASFQGKVKKSKNARRIDLTKSLSKLLPFVVAATAVAALTQPSSFTWVKKAYYAPALGGIMLSIGVQMSIADFALVLQRPLPVLIGCAAQYIAKPLLGVLAVKLFSVPAAFASGLILTACVAGAQLSSYAAFLGEADVALSIVLTSLTTISSVAITPLLTGIFIGSVVPVNLAAMATSIVQVVIAPVFLGVALNTYAQPLVDKVRVLMPVVAMFCTSLCIGSPLALNRGKILSAEGLQLMFPILAFHIGGFILGYWICRVPFWRQGDKESRTISLCTGMQSSTLAMLLASQFLGASNTVPPACSVVVMALMGLSLATFWGKEHQVRDFIPRLDYSNLRLLES